MIKSTLPTTLALVVVLTITGASGMTSAALNAADITELGWMSGDWQTAPGSGHKSKNTGPSPRVVQCLG